MELKKKKSISSRNKFLINKNLLSNHVKIKYLRKRIRKRSGRNDTGSITIRHRGGGNKNIFRIVSFGCISFKGIVLSTEYDPYRNSFISRVFELKKKKYFYVLSINNVFPGSIIECNPEVELKLGNRIQIKNLPIGSIISNVSQKENGIGLYSRSAGTFCQLIQKSSSNAYVKIPSGKIVSININSYGTLGVISNSASKLQILGQAGVNRHKGIRPFVRGVAMNPVDHPHGGGEGKTSGGRPSVSLWGRPAKGKPTRKKSKVINVAF